MAAVIFVVDDDDGSREAMARALARVGHEVHQFPAAEEALARVRAGDPVDAVVSDVKMPGMDGFALLREVRSLRPDLAFLLVTAYGEVQSAVVALTEDGADDYLTKPVEMQELRKRVQLHLERRVLQRENVDLRQRVDKLYGFENIIGHSAAMESLIERLRLVAPAPSTVLIVGESGTGKELIANALHQNSPRSEGPFVPVNCGAIPGEILESELFGHERGAFTGAHQRRIGLIESAHRGTLFLDEISELSPDLQVKLLRVLEERRITRVGGNESIAVDFRLVAATNRRLEQWVADGRFRQDLYYRLKVVTVYCPALRERAEDIPLLVQHFIAQFNTQLGRDVKGIHPWVLAALKRQPWPGNVRELRNVIESLVLFAKGGEVSLEELPAEYRAPAPPVQAATGVWEPRPMVEVEKEAILRALEFTGGHRARAAKLLDIGLRTLQRKLKEYGEVGPGDEDEGDEGG